jgi:hypothetical protein
VYFFRPVFHGPEGRGFTSCQTVCALLSEKFGLAPTPLRLCNLPVGAPSGTAEAGDSTSRDLLCPKLGRDLTITGRTPGGTLQRKAQPSRAERHRSQPWRGGWPERPNGSQLFNLTPGCKPSTEKVRPVAHPPTDRTAARKPRSAIARPSAAPCGGRNFVAAPPATGPSPKKNLARRSLSARQGNPVKTIHIVLTDFLI